MDFTTHINGAPSSKGMIAGVPFAAGHAHNVLDAEYLLAVAISTGLDEGRESLRKSIMDYPDWAPYQGKVEIEWHDGGFEYILTGTDEENEAMKLLEYGTPDRAPQPVLRTQALRLQGETTDKITKAVTEAVGLG